MRHQRSPHRLSSAAIWPLFLLLLLLFPIFAFSRQFVLILSRDDFNDASSSSPSEGGGGDAASFHAGVESSNWDEFGDSESDSKLDPGSWLPILQSESDTAAFDPKTRHDANPGEALYFSGVRKMVFASSSGDSAAMVEGASEIEAAATVGHPAAQSALGFLYQTGQMRKLNRGKAFLYHFFAAESGNMQSKMALAYSYFRQNMHEKAVMLYAKLAEVAVKSFLVSEDSPVIESVRIHHGVEENKEELKKSRGEEDEDFQILEYQAHKGNALAMYKIGLFYYFGLRGLRLDHKKALSWFLKATEKGEPSSMELLGEIYARGAGVEKNYTKAYELLKLAAQKKLYSAYNGLGFLYIKGYGVEQKNYTKAKEYFEIAALHEDAGGHYNLGVLYLKGIGVRKDVKLACKYFIFAANAGQPKAFYQLAKMFHTGVGLRRNIIKATALYKLVAERGPWSSLSRWALESYLKGDVGKAFLLYSRMAELGYEVAQSNSAWILDKYGDRSMCMGESGICTEIERHHRAHSLWWQASEQGNEHAALLIGDAYYYGRGTDRDYARAAEAYMHAKAQSNAQAMFNLGYMHEHGQGLPSDLHLAKRYYDQAQEIDPTAKLPVKLALTSLWIRKNYADSLLVVMIDSLPEVYPKVETWVKTVLLEEGNLTILTLSVCLITVLYLREWQRRHGGAAAAGQVAAPHHPNELGAQALN